MLVSKEYSMGDEEHILNLFQKSFGKQLSYEYWMWRYLENPVSNTDLINLVWDNNQVVAHYAVSPTEMFIEGKKHNAALSMTTMTDPNYQGKGLFTRTAAELFANQSNSLDVIFGVPNNNSLRGFTEKLNFKLIKEIPMLRASIKNKEFRQNITSVEINEFDNRFDDFFEIMKSKYNIIMTRNSKYLTWRFLSNPDNQYNIFAYVEKNNILGYMVVKTFNDGVNSSGDIVDILVSDDSILKDLLLKVFSFFQAKKIYSISTWFNDHRYNSTFKESGFIEDNYFHFIVRDNREEVNEKLYDFKNWYITMSDIDLF